MSIYLEYLWNAIERPEIRSMLLMFGVSAFLFLCFAVFTLNGNRRYAEEIEELEEEESPTRIYSFSKQSRMLIYHDGIQIERNGTAVSSFLNDVWEVGISGDDEDRILDVRRMTNDGPVLERVHVGPLPVQGADRVKETILHYAR